MHMHVRRYRNVHVCCARGGSLGHSTNLPTACAPAFAFQPVAHAAPLARAQELAAAALQDGSAAPDVARHAQLGSNGASLQNVERDVHRQARIMWDMRLQTDMRKAPYKDAAGVRAERHVAMLLPREVFGAVFSDHPHTAKERIVG
eukprot:13185881-Alexandrium_andersonii.AAC.1